MATEGLQCATCGVIGTHVLVCIKAECGRNFCPECVLDDYAGSGPRDLNEGNRLTIQKVKKTGRCSICRDNGYCDTAEWRVTKQGHIKRTNCCPVNIANLYLFDPNNECRIHWVQCGIRGCKTRLCHIGDIKLFKEKFEACPDIPEKAKKIVRSRDWQPCEPNPPTMWGKRISGTSDRTGRGCGKFTCPAFGRTTHLVAKEESRVATVNRALIEFNGLESSASDGDSEFDPCSLGNDEAQKVVGRTFGKRGYHHLDPTNIGFTKTKTGYKRKVEFKLQKKGLKKVYKVKRSSLRITDTVIPERAKRRSRPPTKLKPNKTLACYDKAISVDAAAAQVVHDVEGPDMHKDKHTATQWFETYNVDDLSKDWFFLNCRNEDSKLCVGKLIKVGMRFQGDSKTSYFRATVVAIYDDDDFDDFPLSHPVHKMTKSGQFTVQVWDHALLDRSFNCNSGGVCRVRTFDDKVEKEHPTVLRAREAARAHDDKLRAQRAERESSQSSSGGEESDRDLDGFVEN